MSAIQSARTVTVPCPFCETLNRVDLDRLDDRPKCGSCGRPILMDRPLKVGDQNLERVVADAKVPVLVDFYADWCAPCKMMAPILDEVAHDRSGSLLVTKLDTDRNPTMAVRYSIRGIPTLILFHEGREVGRQTGAVPKAQLESWIDATIGAREA